MKTRKETMADVRPGDDKPEQQSVFDRTVKLLEDTDELVTLNGKLPADSRYPLMVVVKIDETQGVMSSGGSPDDYKKMSALIINSPHGEQFVAAVAEFLVSRMINSVMAPNAGEIMMQIAKDARAKEDARQKDQEKAA